jgi:hypothetical protein
MAPAPMCDRLYLIISAGSRQKGEFRDVQVEPGLRGLLFVRRYA